MGMYKEIYPGGKKMDNQNVYPVKDDVVTVKEWVITMLILLIPVVNIVMTFVWAFGSNTKSSKANYFKASIILWLIGIALYFILMIMGIFSFGMLNSYI
jgi:heme/copper-type cytochrome/quinol oxidase subunit 2